MTVDIYAWALGTFSGTAMVIVIIFVTEKIQVWKFERKIQEFKILLKRIKKQSVNFSSE